MTILSWSVSLSTCPFFLVVLSHSSIGLLYVFWIWIIIKYIYCNILLFVAFLFFKIFSPCHVICRILVSCPGIESVPPVVKAQNLNHWTAREVLRLFFSFWGRPVLLWTSFLGLLLLYLRFCMVVFCFYNI